MKLMPIVMLFVPAFCVLAGLTAVWWKIGQGRAAIQSEWASAFVAMAVGGLTLAATLAGFVASAFFVLIVMKGKTLAELRLQGSLSLWVMGMATYGTILYAPAAGLGVWTVGELSRPSRHRGFNCIAAIVGSWGAVKVSGVIWNYFHPDSLSATWVCGYLAFVCVGAGVAYKLARVIWRS